MTFKRPKLSFWQIINMNVGFFGIQYSFGLQQSAVNPIYDFLHASPDQIPILNLAGPLTGLLIQPIIGAMSDKTWHPRWGRRKPYFFIGAIICSIALFLFPFSSSLWMAAGLLWILDVGNNTAMAGFLLFCPYSTKWKLQKELLLKRRRHKSKWVTIRYNQQKQLEIEKEKYKPEIVRNQ